MTGATAIYLTSRDAFAGHHGVSPMKWSGHNVSRLLRLTGERPERVAAIRSMIEALADGCFGCSYGRTPCTGGVFDHGEMWGRWGKPWAIVGHPYGIRDELRSLLDDLARFTPALRVSVDDWRSYYGFGTHHVRIELVEPRTPWTVPPSTRKTRAALSAARKAFREEFSS